MRTFLTPEAWQWQTDDKGSCRTSPDEQFFFFQLTAASLADDANDASLHRDGICTHASVN